MKCNFNSCDAIGRFTHYFDRTRFWCLTHRSENMIDNECIFILENGHTQTSRTPISKKRKLVTPWAPRKIYHKNVFNNNQINIDPDMSIYDDIAIGSFKQYDWKKLARTIPLLAYLNGAQK